MSYALNPAGPEGSFHPYAGSGVGVSKYSKNPEMAWLWVQWATAKGTQEAKLLGKYNNFPTRTSVTQAPEIASELQSGTLGVASLVNQVWEAGSLTTLLGVPQMATSRGHHRGRPERGLQRVVETRRRARGRADEGGEFGDADLHDVVRQPHAL